MTHGEAVKTVQESLVTVMTGTAVWVEDGGPLYEALLILVDEDAHHPHRFPVEQARGYHGADGWSVPVRGGE